MRTVFACLAVALSIYIWRSGRAGRNMLIRDSDLPLGYWAKGKFDTQCTILKHEAPDDTFKFCEDAIFWDLLDGQGNLNEQLVLISCDSGRKAWNTVMGPLRDPEPRGSLWMYRPEENKPHRLNLSGYPEGHDFHPLGLEIYPSYAGNSSNLFVVNHARRCTVVEQFTVSPSTPTTAAYVRTLTSPYFVSPNSIALTSPTSFYVTNDHFLTRRLPSILGQTLPLVETILGLPLGWVAHVSVDPNTTSITPILSHTFSAPFIPFANGVAISPSGSQVAVAATSLGQVYMYTRDSSSNALKYTDSVEVPFTPDNLMYNHHGALIVAGHAHFPSLLAVAANKSVDAVAPSWILSITHRTEVATARSGPTDDMFAPISTSKKVPAHPKYELQTLFQSNGTAFSSSSSGGLDPISDILYVTGLYEEGLLVCRP